MIYILTLPNRWVTSYIICLMNIFVIITLSHVLQSVASMKAPRVSPNSILWTKDAAKDGKTDRDTYEMYYPLDKIADEPVEKDTIGFVLQQIYDSLNKRMDEFNERLTRLEKTTTTIEDRLTKLDCYDVKVENPLATSGVYEFFLDYKGKRPVKVFCDMITEGGGWTVIQRRVSRRENETRNDFHKRKFHDYTLGFGSPKDDFWLGLENMNILTNSRYYELFIELQDFQDFKAHARYSKFYIDDKADGYRIHVSGYSGDAGDAMSADIKADNFTADNMMFSTVDEDRDTSHEINCSDYWNIGGWWYNRCSWANLNGPYKFAKKDEGCIGINWHKWRNMTCLKATKMMIRPVTRR